MNTVNDCLLYIDDLDISESDYDVISSLLDTIDDRLFLKILEEVKDGNLYWSDFKRFLSNTNYPSILRDNLSEQKKISDYMEKLTKFRETIKNIKMLSFSDDNLYKEKNIIERK